MPARKYFVTSAQQVDPLSWFTGPLVPLSFGVLTVIYGALMLAVTWPLGGMRELQVVAIAVSASASLVIHFATRPARRQGGWLIGAIAMALSVAGMVLSARAYADTPLPVELWWAPGGLTLAIASLGPYFPVRRVLVLGGAAIVVAVPLSFSVLNPPYDAWGPLETLVIIAYPPLLGIAATATFAHAVVSTMLPMLESPSRIMVVGQQVRDEVAQRIERVTVAQLTARAAPFLEGIADTGRITPTDRALAGQLARRLRDDLVTQSSLSWLDSIADQSRLVVVDPDHLARRMTNPQRTALRALLQAILDTPGIDSGSLLVDLRAAPDGATAVGVSLEMALPEGRRIMHLAPYYLTLKTAVDDLQVDRGRLSFRIPKA